MAIDVARLEAITFDSYSTLVDVDSTAPAVEGYVDDPVSFAREWHARAAMYGMIGNYIDTYETYYALHRDALEYLLAAEGIDATVDELEETTAVYHDMEPFDDVREGLERLDEKGYRLGIVTNGDPSMLDSLVATVRVGHVLSATVSADEIHTHKPAVELYEHAAGRLGVDTTAVAHVSNSPFDVQGAMHAGMQGVWLNRQDAPPEPFGPDPDLAIERMDELVDLV